MNYRLLMKKMHFSMVLEERKWYLIMKHLAGKTGLSNRLQIPYL